MAMPEYNWKCTQKTCLVRDELLQHVNANSRRFGWHATNYTFLWGMTLEDGIKYRLGTFKPHSLVQSMTSLRIRDVSDVPTTFDARKEWPSYVHPILDQGNCGSSWALSTASVAADRLTLHSQGAYSDMLSAQQILDCDIDYKQKGCEGGHLDRAWWYMRTIGVVSEPCYPYNSAITQVRGKCSLPRYMMRLSATSCPSGSRGLKSPVYQVAPPYKISPNEKEIMKEIMENGPVQALMHVKEDFFLYKNGVYHHSLPADFLPPNRHKTGYHSVKILGWGTDYSTGKPLKYWLCANSWGLEWGERGYFRILRGVNESEIESFIIGVWGKVNGRELRRHNRRTSLRQRLRHSRRRLRHRRHLMRRWRS
ncbi:hypothetical protein LSH36_229g01023 [Paralvinella palmiformis]|uniref:Peptidase C1A papain C-terminal domain-containing protein n=1 Tax=Paralvinella palmiformis TaxID=53620 RepID=A0AAD9JMB8_9ANNE|nr:hypothetical protein LSH36_229g01023 [Paralvinella palmiformis]